MAELHGIDLFSGAGGSSWGAKLAGVTLRAAFDKWSLAADVYQANFPETKFFNSPLETIEPRDVAAEIGAIDLILASPECTSHSPAKGSAPRCETSRETAFEVVKFARAFRPRWIVIENVVSMRRWKQYTALLSELGALGYGTREQVLDSADFGVPQRRRRLFITCDLVQAPPMIQKSREITRAALEILRDDYPLRPLRAKTRAKATLERAERAFSVIGDREPFLLVYYGSDHSGGWQRLEQPLRTITTVDRFALVVPANGEHHMRMLQVPELANAMGFPHELKLEHGTRRERIHLIGNAVCPPVMCAVVKQLTAVRD
jgi:DNA (cytosine-5)-methyltransferase 1